MMMFKRLEIPYITGSWLRYLALLTTALAAILLVSVSGGFPPSSWYVLANVLSHLSLLWPAQKPRSSFSGADWQRNSADNLLDMGFDEPQATLAYVALTHDEETRPPVPSQNRTRVSRPSRPGRPRRAPTAPLETPPPPPRQVSPSHQPSVPYEPPMPPRQMSPILASDTHKGRPYASSSPAPYTTPLAGRNGAAPTVGIPLVGIQGADVRDGAGRADTRNGDAWLVDGRGGNGQAGNVRAARTTTTLTQQFLVPTRVLDKTAPATKNDIGIGWNPGIKRQNRPNEDAVLAVRATCTFNGQLLPLSLFVVADGMGGHSSGRIASHLTVQSMMQAVLPAVQNGDDLNSDSLVNALVDGVQWANQTLFEYREEHGVDLGTTVTAAMIVDSNAYIVNVGDSRTYLYRQGKGLEQITQDHSIVARLVANGTIAPDDIYTHPDRNKVYRGLGDKETVQVDWFIQPLQEGDYLILCSDGLWEMVRDPQIERILRATLPDASAASASLIEAALHNGGVDNVSVIVAH